jgi:hypothetical protein
LLRCCPPSDFVSCWPLLPINCLPPPPPHHRRCRRAAQYDIGFYWGG